MNRLPINEANPPGSRAVAYVRMSTDHQDLSIGIQLTAIRSYAELHGLPLVHVYEDAGRSGLQIANRVGMKQLLRDVLCDPRPFEVVLVYDISRWGRFQDTDASAYYEYTCRLHGAQVIYVQEPFINNQEPMTALIKALKRTMAAEYSRELAVKCRAGQDRAAHLGFQMGHLPNIGIRREAVDRQGNCRPLSWRQRKGIQSERIRWTLGPAEEVDLVRRVFLMYAEQGASIKGVAQQLQTEGVLAARGGVFTPSIVASLLRCEAFAGNFVWGRERVLVRRAMKRRPETRVDGVLEQVISPELWKQVQDKLWERRRQSRNREQMINDLRRKLDEFPAMCSFDVEALGLKSRKAYANAFGSMTQAFKLAGRDPNLIRALHERRKVASRQVGNAIQRDIEQLLNSDGISCAPHPRSRLLHLGGGLTIRLQLTWPRIIEGATSWYLHKRSEPRASHVLNAVMAEDSTVIRFQLFSYDEFEQTYPWLSASVPPGTSPIRNGVQLVSVLRREVQKIQSLDRSSHRIKAAARAVRTSVD